MSSGSVLKADHLDYLKHECDRLIEIRKSKWYNGEMIYKMYNATQWYLTMVTEWAQSFNTPIQFCPYCGDKL